MHKHADWTQLKFEIMDILRPHVPWLFHRITWSPRQLLHTCCPFLLCGHFAYYLFIRLIRRNFHVLHYPKSPRLRFVKPCKMTLSGVFTLCSSCHFLKGQNIYWKWKQSESIKVTSSWACSLAAVSLCFMLLCLFYLKFHLVNASLCKLGAKRLTPAYILAELHASLMSLWASSGRMRGMQSAFGSHCC